MNKNEAASLRATKWNRENRERRNETLRRWKKNNPEKTRASNQKYKTSPGGRLAMAMYFERSKDHRANYGLLKAYGITLDQKKALFEQQNKMCANLACREPLNMGKSTHVDHDHRTNKVRGLLCNGCNRAIGYIDDSPCKAKGLANYLEKHQAGN